MTRELEDIKVSRVEQFGIERFQGGDNDIRFYTGLPSYDIVLCLYHYLEPYLIYFRYRPSKHEQPTRKLLNCQRLLQPVGVIYGISMFMQLFFGKKTLHPDLIVVIPLYREYVQHCYHFKVHSNIL